MRLFVHNPRVLEIAALLPVKEAGSPGRPRENPEALTALAWCAKGAFPSMRKVAHWFRDEANWAWLRQTWREEYGIELNAYPPARKTLVQQLHRMRPLVASIATRVSEMALDEARRQGRFSGTAQTAATPNRGNVVVADGTVPKLRMKPETIKRLTADGAQPRKRNGHRMSVPNGHLYKEGTGEWVQGVKFVIAVSRPDVEDDDTNLRLVLDARPVAPGEGGEAAVSVDMLLGLREMCAQFHGVRYDGAFRGAHLSPLMRSGLSVLSNPGETNSMEARPLELIECGCPGRSHQLYSEAGWLCVGEHLDDGTLHLERLPGRHVTFVKNPKRNDYRCYLTVTLPCECTHRTRLDTTDEADERGLSTSERLRQFPPGTPEYDNTYGWRNDVESHNNNLDSTHYRGRLVVDDPTDQYLLVLAHGFARNLLAEAVYNDKRRAQATERAA